MRSYIPELLKKNSQFVLQIHLYVAEQGKARNLQDVPWITVFHVLQHRNAIFMESCKYADIFLSLKTSSLVKLLNFSWKKVPRMFGQFRESIYLCIRNREGHPLRLKTRKSSLKIFSIQTSSTRSDLVMSSRDRVIERTVK